MKKKNLTIKLGDIEFVKQEGDAPIQPIEDIDRKYFVLTSTIDNYLKREDEFIIHVKKHRINIQLVY